MSSSTTRFFLSVITLLLACDASTLLAQTAGSTFLGTRWNIAGAKAVVIPPAAGGTYGPGAANWSIVPMGTATLMPPDADHPVNAVTLDFDGLLPPANIIRPDVLFQQALNIWQVGSLNLWTSLPNVPDGTGVIGDNIPMGNTSNTGDIRAAVLRWDQPVSPTTMVDHHIIAHAFRPDSLTTMLGPGTIGGDAHFRPHLFGPDGMQGTMDDEPTGVRWVDSNAPAPGAVDLLSVMIHEIGHSLGLGHNLNDPNSVMQPIIVGAKRTLSATDKANIRQLYGQVFAVPEPCGALLLSLALCCVCGRRKVNRS